MPGLEPALLPLSGADLIDYPKVASLKLGGLYLAHQAFRRAATAARRADFEAFRRRHGDALRRFACFEVLRRRYEPQPWQHWPSPWRRPGVGDIERFHAANTEHCEFHEFLQWVAERQLAACQDAARRHGMPIGLYIDIAVGIDPDGADAWAQQEAVVGGVSIGAPPDQFNPAGQNWGLAPFNPHVLMADDFAPMRRVLHAAMRHAGAIRLDHVLGLKRVFMIPRGLPTDEGVYVRMPLEPSLDAIAQDSEAARCIVIGEDLGTVPDGLREAMARFGLWRYLVAMFERGHDGRFRAPQDYPAEALAAFNTHDLPTLQGWLIGHDLRVKRLLGVDPGEDDEARSRSHRALGEALRQWAGEGKSELEQIAAFLGATPCRLAMVSMEDVTGVLDQVNIPATVHQHPNWRRKLPVNLEELDGHQALSQVAAVFAAAGRGFR